MLRNLFWITLRCHKIKKHVFVLCRLKYTQCHSLIRRLSTHVPPPNDGVIDSKFEDVAIPKETLTDFVWKEHQTWGDSPALTCSMSDRSYTYIELRTLAQRMAGAFLTTLGLEKGDVVGMILPNVPEFVIACHGAIEAGLVVTCANPLYTAVEIHKQFLNCHVKVIFCVGPLFDQAKEVGLTDKDFKGLVVIGAEEFNVECDEKVIFNFSNLLMNAEIPDSIPKSNSAELALLPYSSGTTGLPKGVMLSHYNLVANICQSHHPKLIGATKSTENYQEQAFTILPFFHIYGFTLLNICLAYGIHVITMPRFVPETYIETLIKFKPHTLFVVPSLITLLANHHSVTREHLSSLQQVVSGAAPASHSLIDKFTMKVGRDDFKLRQGYGMTESSPVTLMTPVDMDDSKIGACGLLVPNTKARIVDIEREVACGPNHSGELLLKGPQVMMGYYMNEKATKETVDSHGWLHTGDVAYYDDDGYFFIVDRTKELIKVKGNQVSPSELEEVIRQMPGVVDVAVVGVPDELAGEVPRAFIVCKSGLAEVTESTVQAFVHPKVAKYKYLEGGVRFIKEIPRNIAGKILRNELKVLGGNEKYACKKP